LEYFQKSQKLNRQQARWSLYLSQFNFALFHQLGRLMGRPDALSHRLDHGAGSENSDVTLLRLELFRIHTMEGITVNGPEIPLLRDVRKVFATEPELEDPVALVARELLKNQKAPPPTRLNGKSRMDSSCFVARSSCHGIRTSVTGLWSSTTTHWPLQDVGADLPELLVAPVVPTRQPVCWNL
jgi:hypothetical protein